MRAELKGLYFDPEPGVLPADPAEFRFQARALVGPRGEPGEESFEVTVCSPEWLAQACERAEGVYDARHHVVVDVETLDVRVLRAFIERRVTAPEGSDWSAVAEKVGRFGLWEFEDYRPSGRSERT